MSRTALQTLALSECVCGWVCRLHVCVCGLCMRGFSCVLFLGDCTLAGGCPLWVVMDCGVSVECLSAVGVCVME